MQSSPQPSIQPKISIQELNNIFCLASKNQNLPEVNNIDKIELFEVNTFPLILVLTPSDL